MVLTWFSAIAGGLALLACFLLAGKGANWLAGYNTMAPAEKAKVDRRALTRSAGAFLLLIALLLEGAGLCAQRNVTWALIALIALILAATAAWVVHVNRSPKFRARPGAAAGEDAGGQRP